MRNHIVTIILMLIAAIAFTLRYFVTEEWQSYCDIAAFVLPTCAALVEIVVSERKGKVTEEKIKKLKENQLSARVEGEILFLETGVEE